MTPSLLGRSTLLFCLLLCWLVGFPAAAGTTTPNLVPALKAWEPAAGQFQLSSRTRIVVVNADPALIALFEARHGWLSKLRYTTGLPLRSLRGRPRDGDIVFDSNPSPELLAIAKAARLENKPDAAVKAHRSLEGLVLAEGHRISVTKDRVIVQYKERLGALRALQTLTQILLTNAEAVGRQRTLATGRGHDFPVYEHRGVMFDVARSFIPVDALVGMIDKFGLYKINVLRLHLSDDFPMNSHNSPDAQGFFRLYSPKFPQLIPPDKLFYTERDWARLEAAAARNGVKIVPEIESPGHAKSFTDAFPDIPRYTLTTLDVRSPGDREKVASRVASVIGEFLPWFRSGEIHLGTDETDKIAIAGVNYQTTNEQVYRYANLLRENCSSTRTRRGSRTCVPMVSPCGPTTPGNPIP